MNPLPTVHLVGPTASGKSALALALAGRLHGEIVSVDSMQVYRGLDIGTAKPTSAERARVPHHLLDVADLHETFDAAQFIRLARRAEEEIRARGRRPILCGGTGLYFKALREGLGEAPPADATVRAALEAAPLADLLEELQQTDPVTHGRIDRRNPRRVVRALEVIRLTGRPFSEQRSVWSGPGATAAAGGCWFGLEREPEDLRARINVRVEEMFARGLVAETRGLMGQGLEANPTARQAIGYRQVLDHLHGGPGLAETVALVKTRTWQYARRQMTWFRRQLPVEWIRVGPDVDLAAVAAALAARLTN